jgi:hypothetical protein
MVREIGNKTANKNPVEISLTFKEERKLCTDVDALDKFRT